MSALRKPAPEDKQQAALMQWARTARLPDASDVQHRAQVADYLYHCPNGGQRNRLVAMKLKAQGVKAGVSDLHLPLARHGFNGLWIELKTSAGTVQASQREWLDRMTLAGHMAVVCWSWEAAMDTIKNYVGLAA